MSDTSPRGEAIELLPCPFCGDDGELAERHNPMSKWRHSVDCSSTTCGASGPVEATKAEAIAAWNTRSPTPPSGIIAEPSEAMIEETARLICFVKGYDPDAAVGESRVQWQTFTELARQTVVRIDASPLPSGETIGARARQLLAEAFTLDSDREGFLEGEAPLVTVSEALRAIERALSGDSHD